MKAWKVAWTWDEKKREKKKKEKSAIDANDILVLLSRVAIDLRDDIHEDEEATDATGGCHLFQDKSENLFHFEITSRQRFLRFNGRL